MCYRPVLRRHIMCTCNLLKSFIFTHNSAAYLCSRLTVNGMSVQSTRSETLPQPRSTRPQNDVWAQRAFVIVDNCSVTAKCKPCVPWNSKVPTCPDVLSLFSMRDGEEMHRERSEVNWK